MLNIIRDEDETNSTRRQVLRYALGMMAAVGADPLLVDGWMQEMHHATKESGGQIAGAANKYRPLADGSPIFFNPSEFRALTSMVDVIIPRTDTPGAKEAGVPLYIDIIASGDPDLGGRLRAGLRQLDAAARSATQKDFADAPVASQTAMLQDMFSMKPPGNEFFETVKAMTIVGYYSSEIGLFEELHFIGNQALANFPGCPHGGHPVDVPERPPKTSSRASAPIADPGRRWPFPSSDNVTGVDL